jgi:hypothetical protein
MLTAENFEGLLPLKDCALQAFRISDDLWARLIYDAAVSSRQRILPQEHLLKAMTPLYLGRTASFVLETQGLTSVEAEERIEALCVQFEKYKPYLLEQWQSQKEALPSGTEEIKP